MVADPGDRTHRDPEQSCLELVDRLSAGEHLRHRHRTGPGEGTLSDRRDEAGPDHGRLAAPARPDDGEEACGASGLVQPGEETLCELTPSAEVPRVGLAERTQPLVRVPARTRAWGCRCRTPRRSPGPPQRTTRRPRPPASTLSARTATGSEGASPSTRRARRANARTSSAGSIGSSTPISKSHRYPFPSASKSTFDARTSPWVTPCRCANARAEAICSITRRARSGSSDSVRASRPSRLPPRRYRVTTYARPGSRQ